MKEVITDLVQIRTLGEKKRHENERFRRHLKTRDSSDRILRRIGEEIEDLIDCTACANCCRVATTRLIERDVERIARFMRLTPAKFLAGYTDTSESEGVILKRDKKTGCVFLSGNTCTIYEERPETCQKFPHIVRGNGSIASRMWEFIDRATYCPIVYNSLEAFKAETDFKR